MLSTEFVDPNRRWFSNHDRQVVVELCKMAEAEIRMLLPSLPESITVVIQGGSRVIPETGELGVSVAPGRVSWTVDPKHPGGIEATARSQLRFTLFHELHHQARGWTFTGGRPRTCFMDGPISEGLATAFERDAGGRSPSWGEYPADVETLVGELLDLPLDTPYRDWMFQHPDGRRWIGYRAGTYLADRAIAASRCSSAELVSTTTEEILRLAGYSCPAGQLTTTSPLNSSTDRH